MIDRWLNQILCQAMGHELIERVHDRRNISRS